MWIRPPEVTAQIFMPGDVVFTELPNAVVRNLCRVSRRSGKYESELEVEIMAQQSNTEDSPNWTLIEGFFPISVPRYYIIEWRE